MARKPSLPGLLVRTQLALERSQAEFGRLLGSSRRTVQRWTAGQSTPTRTQVEELARLVHPRDAELAAQLADHLGETFESLGIVVAQPAPSEGVVEAAPAMPTPMETPRPAPPPQRPAPTLLVEAVVCAAADAMNLSPSAVRASLRAAFERAHALELTVAEVVEALGTKNARPPSRERT